MILSHEQKSKLWDMNVKINHIIFTPFEAMHQHEPTEALIDFVGVLTDGAKTAKDLVKQVPKITEAVKELQNDAFSDDLIQSDWMPWFADLSSDFPYVLQLEIPVPKNFTFRDGKAVSWSIGGLYQLEWIMAKDMQHAYELIIEKYEAVKSEAIKKQLAKEKKK